MKDVVKHAVGIAGGVVLGGLASNALNGLGKVVKKVVKNAKKKGA